MKIIRESHKNISKVIKEIHKLSKKNKACDKFTGKESFDELCHLLLSPQGIEFCTNNSFPSLEYFDMVDKQKAEENGIYINAGMIRVSNKQKVLLVGDTDAILNYDNQEHPYNVTIMHNARAKIIADKYAVVFTFGQTENITVDELNNAIVR